MCGGGPDPEDFNKPTPQEHAQAETAAKMFNEYLRGKGVEKAYLADISANPALAAAAAKGTAATDLALKLPATTRAAPASGMSPTAIIKGAQIRSKIGSDLDTNAVTQQAAGRKTYVENAMGVQSTADTAQSGLANEAVKRNLNEAESQQRSAQAGMSAVSSLAGAGSSVLQKYFDPAKKTA